MVAYLVSTCHLPMQPASTRPPYQATLPPSAYTRECKRSEEPQPRAQHRQGAGRHPPDALAVDVVCRRPVWDRAQCAAPAQDRGRAHEA